MISILLPDLRGGGAERVCVDLARAFAARGHQVEFVLMRAEGDFLLEAQREFSVVDLRAAKVRYVLWRLARYLRERRPAVLIANMWPLTSMAVVGRAISGHECRLMLVDHGMLSLQYAGRGKLHDLLLRVSMTMTYPRAELVAAVSAGSALDIARLAGMSLDKVAVLHNPVLARAMPNAAALAQADALWGCAPGGRILAVGSFKPVKNYPLLFRAFAAMPRTEARLMLLGQGAGEGALRALVTELGLADRIIFAGFHADPSPYYATADQFVLSSNHEGLPTVLIEALSFGLPVVSTDCPSGPAEILENGRWGKLVPVGDAEALARAMDEALSAPVDHEALKCRAADFSPEIAARKYLDLLGLP